MTIKNSTNYTLTFFDARNLASVDSYSYKELQNSDMLIKLRGLSYLKKSFIDIYPGSTIRCYSYGFGNYYIYCEGGVCYISNKCGNIECSSNGILSVSENSDDIVISAK